MGPKFGSVDKWICYKLSLVGLGGGLSMGSEEVCPSIICTVGELQDHKTERG